MVEKLLPIIKTLVGEGVNELFIEAVLKRLVDLGYMLQETDAWAIAFAIQKVENTVKNSCNTALIPDGLRNTAIDMVCGEFLFTKKQSGTLKSFDLETAIKSVQAGDTNVTFRDDSTPEQRFDSLLSFLVNNGRGEFVCYRKIKW